uniref:Uncharacterized protein n=1 Tax=Brassica oleracea TaxID=3712 RepID=A0A3P6H079_BRAOL|nr:unnamed protein product [Brassica oleracea]
MISIYPHFKILAHQMKTRFTKSVQLNAARRHELGSITST